MGIHSFNKYLSGLLCGLSTRDTAGGTQPVPAPRARTASKRIQAAIYWELTSQALG